jgi:hypothetical protein
LETLNLEDVQELLDINSVKKGDRHHLFDVPTEQLIFAMEQFVSRHDQVDVQRELLVVAIVELVAEDN